jgi:hypothetical protein
MVKIGIGQNFHVEFQQYLQNLSWDIFIALSDFILEQRCRKLDLPDKF